MLKTCPMTGQPFELTAFEMAMRKKLGIEGEPKFHPIFRFMQLGAFWQHWNLHKRKCDKTGNQIISVFSENCPYPVWQRDEWIKNANPPGADYDPGTQFFPQLWELFRRCPIPHNVGAGNENCEYTDDWWYCKNCYLCHSGVKCEDLRYCYRTIHCKDSQYCVFSFESEKCVDLIDCHSCFRVAYASKSWQCRDSAFLYDCRNCADCMFCTNLRNKSYCFGNEQLTKEEYEKKRATWDLRSRSIYESGKAEFAKMLLTRAWHRALFVDRSENATGNYLDQCKNCENSFFLSERMEDCVNVFRGGIDVKDCVDVVSPFGPTEIVFNSSLPQDHCYDIRCCCDMVQCKYMEYSAHCFQCEHCFGCCGLVGKKYHLFNKPYEPEEFERRKKEIVGRMKQENIYGDFFPGSFAASPYEESLAGFYWPLSKEQAAKYGFWLRGKPSERTPDAQDAATIPDRCDTANTDIAQKVFWDATENRPFQIQAADVTFAQDLAIPLPHTYYMRRIQENFRWIPFNGTLRTTACGKCETKTQTSWPKEYDGRILCEGCYLKEVY